MSSAFDQSRYQVRLEWGAAGLARLAPSDVVVVVDVLGFSTTVTDRVAAGETVPLDDAAPGSPSGGAVVAGLAAATDAVVLVGCLRNAAAVAAEALAEQQRRGARTSIAVVAAGDFSDGAAGLRFAVEDLLGAGAVIDALGALGVDHTSPEAAAACEAFRGLRGAVKHLLSASGSGQELRDVDRADEVSHAAQIDALASVPVLRDGLFVAAFAGR